MKETHPIQKGVCGITISFSSVQGWRTDLSHITVELKVNRFIVVFGKGKRRDHHTIPSLLSLEKECHSCKVSICGYVVTTCGERST